jgi:signal peptidase I
LSNTEELQSNIEAKKFFYSGNSMNTTFSPGHILYVKPKVNEVQPGDVIVFKKGEEYIVHRINSVSSKGIQTRGDNNLREDAYILSDEQIMGKVVIVDDGKELRAVIGGRKGLQKARARWGFRSVMKWMRPVIGAPYRWLKSARIVAKIWHPGVIQVKTVSSSGPMIKYIVGGKTVATWIPQLRSFQCRRLYDLVIFPPD